MRVERVGLSAARVLWALATGKHLEAELFLLRRNGDLDDIRIENLVPVSRTELKMNDRAWGKLKGPSMRGIVQCHRQKSWSVLAPGKGCTRVGSFATLEEAIRVRDEVYASAGWGSLRTYEIIPRLGDRQECAQATA
jgi:hypothetical protein